MWLGVAFTVFFLWLALRDVDFGDVARTLARARWVLLFAVSIPAYLLLNWLRALRWQKLVEPIRPIATGPLFRAVSVGFMANNVFPMRMGEVVRAWYLARESGASAAAVFGTVILERAIDTVSLLLLIFLVVGILGGGGEADLQRGAVLLAPLAVVPIAGLVLLKKAPDRIVGLAVWLLRPFPERVSAFVESLLRRFTEGLGALSGGRHLVWIALYSFLIWVVFSAPPILIGFVALDIDLGSPFQSLVAAWTTQAAIGVAVALPSAPGFFGIFHWACKLALVRFGVDPGTAVAAGTLIHVAMWTTLTGTGLAVLRWRQTSLGEVDQAVGSEASPAGKGPPPSRR